MKKQILIILSVLVSTLSFACDCDDRSSIIEFYSSEYVFEGKIISKIYAKDSMTYKVIFEISKHYKKGDCPKILEFNNIEAEGKYTGVWSSCDWSAEKNQNWIVYAQKYEGGLFFTPVCSNSRIIDDKQLSEEEQRFLDNANSFRIRDYVYNDEVGFNYCKNITNIDSILKKGKICNYKDDATVLNVIIDSSGNLKSVIRRKGLERKKDTVFNLITKIESANRTPITEFEKDAIELISQVKKWEIKRHWRTNVSVSYTRHIWVYYNQETKKWSYGF